MQWDLIIAHPPCTYMTKAGAVRMRVNGEIVPERFEKAMEAKAFFMKFYEAECPRIAIENPTPMKIVGLPPYQQAIQPYQFGHPYSKRTCLWLKGLPPLMPTEIILEPKPYVNVDVRTLTGITGDSRGAKSVILKPAPKHSEELPRLWPNSGEVSVVDDIKLALLGDNGSSCSYQGRLSGGDGDAGGDGMKEHWKPVKGFEGKYIVCNWRR